MSNLIAKNETEQRLAEMLVPLITDNGFELICLRVMARKATTVQIMIERADETTLTVDDCATMSHEISALLDVEDPIKADYTLEVSSAGIDRPLTRLKDFERWQGFDAKLETMHLVGGQKRFRGTLGGLKADKIQLDTPEGRIGLDFNALSGAKLMLTDALIAQSLKAQKNPEPTL